MLSLAALRVIQPKKSEKIILPQRHQQRKGLCGVSFIWPCCVSCGFNFIEQPKKEIEQETRRRGDAEEEKILAGTNELFPPLTPQRLRASCSIFFSL
jgi:hypothetical protein